MKKEDYFFETIDKPEKNKVLVLIIYDISDNKRRIKFAKFLQGYGTRVQKSAFEAMLTQQKYEKMMKQMEVYVSEGDSIRVYRLSGKGQITSFGRFVDSDEDDVIII